MARKDLKKFGKKASLSSKKQVALVSEISKELLSLMGTKAKVKVEHDKENDAVMVNIATTDEAGLLIGNRGETVNSIQSVIRMIYRQKAGDWSRIIVNVADWREKQKARLEDLASQTVQRVRESGESQRLYNLNPLERRIVHVSLSDEKDVVTKSEGEGRDRYLEVDLKK